MIENAQDEFHAQHIANSVVERLHRHFAFLDQLSQRQNEIGGGRKVGLHIQSGFDRLAHRVLHVCRDAVLVVEILDGCAVGNHIAAKTKFVS